MLYKVTNNSSSLKALASAAAGENHFVKPDTTQELDLQPLTREQLKKYAAAGLICELVDVDEDDSPKLTKTQKAAAKAAAAAAATVPAASVVTEPVVPAAPEPAVVTPEVAATETPVVPTPEPWQKGLEPPK